ncbi:hypothetical protein ACWDUM_26235 [Rhodococcus sp. NPDC003322]
MGISLEEVAEKLGSIADGLGDAALNVGNSVIELSTGFDLAERSRVGDAQAFGNEQREGIYGEQADLRTRFAGGWDAQQFVEESFDSMSHEQIMASVDRMDPAAVSASAQGWTAIGSALAEGLAGFKSAILGEIGAGWEGVAAASAAKATDAYVKASDQLAAAGSLVGSKVAEAATGITQVKATVPPPEHTSLAEKVFNFVSPEAAMIKGLLHERNEAREQAVQIMKTVYSPVMRQADTQVPTLPSPTSVTDGAATGNSGGDVTDTKGSAGYGDTGYGTPGAADAGETFAPAGGTTPGTGTGTGTGTGAGTGAETADAAASDPYDESSSNPGNADSFAAGQGADSAFAQTDPSSVWTRPAGAGVDGAVPGSGGYGAGTGTPGAAGVGSGGAHGGVGSGGVGGGGVGSGGVGSGTGGGSFGGGTGTVGVPGGPAAAGSAAAPAAAAGAAGRPGMPGAGMMPAGARGRGDDDTEHATPGYLVNVDNGNDLVGNLPLVAPPVLGA